MTTTAGAHRPPHPLGPGVVLAVPDVPAAARRPARRAPPPARGRSVLRPLPARRADGGGRRLPRRPPRGRAAPARAWPPPAAWRWARGTRCPTSSSCPARRSCATCSAACGWPAASAAPWTSGYLPDMFGHVAQMPQLLRLFGFEHAVVWRGVPSAIDRSGFWWTAPDGSTVRAEYLPQGYGNGALVPDDAKALVRRIGEFEEEQGDLLTGPILWMNGTDHLMPQPWLGPGRGRGQRPRRSATSCTSARSPSTCAARPPTGCPRGTGELRSGARANLLMGVASNRVDVKQAAAGAERIARAAGRAAVRPVPARRPLARRAARRGVARGHPQQRPRLDLRLLGRRGVRRRAPPLRRGHPDRRGAHRPGAARPRRHDRRRRPHARDREPVGPHPGRRGGAPPPRRRRARRARSSCRSAWPSGRWSTDAAIEVATVMVAELEYVRNVQSFTVLAADGAELIHVGPRAGRHPRHPADPPAARRPARRARRRAGVGARHHRRRPSPCSPTSPTWPATAGRRGPARRRRSSRSPPTEHRLANGIVTVEVDPDRRHLRHRRPRRARAARRRRRRRRHLQLVPARPRRRRRRADVGRRRASSRPGRCAAGSRSAAPTSCPPTPPTAPAPASQAVEVRTTLELRAGDDLVRVHVELDNHGVRDHRLRVAFPLPERAALVGGRVRLRHRRARAGRRGRPHRAGPGHLPVAPLRHRRRAHRRPRGAARVRAGRPRRRRRHRRRAGRHAPALHRDAVAGPDGHPPAPGRAADADGGPAVAAPRRGAASPSTSAGAIPTRWSTTCRSRCRSPGAAGRRRPGAPTGQALVDHRRRGERGRPRGRASSSCGCSTRRPTPTTVTIDGRAGWLLDLRGRPVQPFEGSFDLSPWQIATVNLGD